MKRLFLSVVTCLLLLWLSGCVIAATGGKGSLPRPPELTELEVAAGKPVSATAFHKVSDTHAYPPGNIVDRRTEEPDGCVPGPTTYWLLPDKQTGWAQIDLQRVFQVTRLRWLNTHNGRCGNDRGTTKYRIVLSDTGLFIGEERVVREGTMVFSITPAYEGVTLKEPIRARYVRFYVDGYYGVGGGLNELEVYANVIVP